MSCGECAGCRGLEVGDRVRDSSGQLGYGRIWALEADGMAVVQFRCEGPITVRRSSLEFVSRP